jgi:hypothetical protein
VQLRSPLLRGPALRLERQPLLLQPDCLVTELLALGVQHALLADELLAQPRVLKVGG